MVEDKVEDILTRKIMTMCRQLNFIKGIERVPRGSGHTVIQLETKDGDKVEIVAINLHHSVILDGVDRVRPTITEDGRLYSAVQGFVGSSQASLLSAKQCLTEINKLKKGEALAKSYKNGIVIYKKTKYQ